ncbi:MAG: BamA/TamA family outer membrane protein [Cyclobacteriaceae bacterium]
MRYLLFIISILLLGSSVEAQLVFGQRRSNSNEMELNYSSPREFEIADIEVKGVQFLDNNALISLSGLKVGDKIKIPGDEISDAIKKLWKQGIIGNISITASKIEGNQIWLTINLVERPRLMAYEFEGVNKSHRTELEDDIELVRGKVITDVLIKNTELSVKRFFEGKGFLNAQVKVMQKSDTVIRNSATLLIKVEKGKKVKIEDIIFVGNENFSEAKLRGKLKKTGERHRFTLPSRILATSIKMLNPINTAHFLTHKDTSTADEFIDKLSKEAVVNIFKPAKFVSTEFKNDKDLLIAFMNSKGYRDALVTYDTTFLADANSLNIEIGIFEGNRYYFRDIDWVGNFVHDNETLETVLAIKRGDVYDMELIQTKLNYDPTGIDISSLYMDNGYLFFNVNPVEIRVEDDSIDVEMRIQEGPQATIDKVTVSGNEKTNDHVVMRELRTIPGQKFNRSELIRTQRELSQLGYFNPETVTPNVVPNMATEKVNIEWQLEEQPSDQIELSGGWGGLYGFIGTLGVSFNNFSVKEALGLKSFPPTGDGQRLSIRMQANGPAYQSLSLSFSEPWLGGRKPNNFGISANQSIIRQRDFSRRFDFQSFTGSMKMSSLTLSLGRRAAWPDDFFVVSNSLTFQQYSLSNYTQMGGSFTDGVSNGVLLNTTIARRSSDNPMYPRRGSDLSLSVNMTPPYSLMNSIDYETVSDKDLYKWLEYHKWNFDAKYYLNIVDKLVLAPRIHFGFINTYSAKAPVGPFERFIVGGSGLTGQGNFVLGNDIVGLRGYPDASTFSNRNTSITPYDSERGILGGTVFTKYVMELRYPISLQPSATIYALTFLEAGNTWNDFTKFNPYDVYRSAGFGVRIFMPAFGLLGLDFGYGFDDIPWDNNQERVQFHFSIGQQIR